VTFEPISNRCGVLVAPLHALMPHRKNRLQITHYSWILLRLAGFSCRSF